MVDVVIAMVILSMFVGLISSLYYNMAYGNYSIRYDAMAAAYAVKIAEDTDKLSYDEVVTGLNYDLDEGYTATVQVEKYNQDDETKEDIIKTVTITINYNLMNTEKSYTLKKLKIKEL